MRRDRLIGTRSFVCGSAAKVYDTRGLHLTDILQTIFFSRSRPCRCAKHSCYLFPFADSYLYDRRSLAPDGLPVVRRYYDRRVLPRIPRGFSVKGSWFIAEARKHPDADRMLPQPDFIIRTAHTILSAYTCNFAWFPRAASADGFTRRDPEIAAK